MRTIIVSVFRTFVAIVLGIACIVATIVVIQSGNFVLLAASIPIGIVALMVLPTGQRIEAPVAVGRVTVIDKGTETLGRTWKYPAERILNVWRIRMQVIDPTTMNVAEVAATIRGMQIEGNIVAGDRIEVFGDHKSGGISAHKILNLTTGEEVRVLKQK